MLDGGSGTDTAVFSGNQADYQITDNGDGTYSVTDADGTDTVTSPFVKTSITHIK